MVVIAAQEIKTVDYATDDDAEKSRVVQGEEAKTLRQEIHNSAGRHGIGEEGARIEPSPCFHIRKVLPVRLLFGKST
jgi:hypothetical protein